MLGPHVGLVAVGLRSLGKIRLHNWASCGHVSELLVLTLQLRHEVFGPGSQLLSQTLLLQVLVVGVFDAPLAFFKIWSAGVLQVLALWSSVSSYQVLFEKR